MFTFLPYISSLSTNDLLPITSRFVAKENSLFSPNLRRLFQNTRHTTDPLDKKVTYPVPGITTYPDEKMTLSSWY